MPSSAQIFRSRTSSATPIQWIDHVPRPDLATVWGLGYRWDEAFTSRSTDLTARAGWVHGRPGREGGRERVSGLSRERRGLLGTGTCSIGRTLIRPGARGETAA